MARQKLPSAVRRTAVTCLRVTPELRAMLDQAAKVNGRSLTTEVMSRLERSFIADEIRIAIREELRDVS